MNSSGQAAVVVSTAQRVALPTATAGPTCSAPPLPDGPCPVCPRLAEQFEPFRLIAFYKAMHQRAVAREAQLKAELESVRAQLRLREQQLFGTKSESHPAPSEAQPRPEPKKPRGQQPGR